MKEEKIIRILKESDITCVFTTRNGAYLNGAKAEIMAMLTTLLKTLYENGTLTKGEINKISELALMGRNEIEGQVEKMKEIKGILEKIKEIEKMGE